MEWQKAGSGVGLLTLPCGKSENFFPCPVPGCMFVLDCDAQTKKHASHVHGFESLIDAVGAATAEGVRRVLEEERRGGRGRACRIFWSRRLREVFFRGLLPGSNWRGAIRGGRRRKDAMPWPL